ncbi:DnaJ subfamily C member 3, variant 2 [Bonamia ostreae]|uniref:DnaJ subfamily C member 3, variant 2 n=1 Tax=Bonamia ostreae TaxID=126728 RepID=A0ABV2AP92_9EUKA
MSVKLKRLVVIILCHFLYINTKMLKSEISAIKDQCDLLLSQSKYRKAVECVNKIIKEEPEDAQNFFKRATAKFAQAKYRLAIKDLEIVIKIDPNFAPGFDFLSKSHSYLCQLDEATKHLKKAMKISSKNKDDFSKRLNDIKKVRNYHRKMGKLTCKDFYSLSKLVAVCEYDQKLLSLYATCLNETKRYNELAKVANKLIKIDKNDILWYELLALAYFNQGKIKMALKVTKVGLRSDPENKKVAILHKKIAKIDRLQRKLEKSRSEYNNVETQKTCDELLKFLPKKTFAEAETQLTLCGARIDSKLFEKAVEACSVALTFDADNFEALKLRGSAYMETEDFERAAMDFKKAHSIDPSDQEVIRKYRAAQQKQKAAEMKDYYKIMGIPRNADKDTIKKAYRKNALKWHPDKWKKKSDKKMAEKRFADLNEANKVLSDDSF